eukprot:SAG11_NODE_6546_length_1290_cov_3.908480_1_plen_187_part_00
MRISVSDPKFRQKKGKQKIYEEDPDDIYTKFSTDAINGDFWRLLANYCPGRGCDFAFFIDNDNEDEQQQHFDCPKCHGSFCLSCKEQWHVGTCEAEAARRRAAGRTDGDVDLQRWAAQVGAKQCPSCNNLVARTGGCNAAASPSAGNARARSRPSASVRSQKPARTTAAATIGASQFTGTSLPAKV